MIDFEWTVKLGDLLTVLGAAYVGSTLLYKRGSRDAQANSMAQGIAEEVEDMKSELKELAKVITELAVQDNKITNLSSQITMVQRNVEDMRRGMGWVGSPRDSVDGEYR